MRELMKHVMLHIHTITKISQNLLKKEYNRYFILFKLRSSTNLIKCC